MILAMEVIPAIDLRDGRVVRLLKGDFDRETVYEADPVEAARAFAAAGAAWLHVVDLDAARGSGGNRALVERIVRMAGLQVQVAGGARTAADVAGWLDAGAARVVMGTTAVRDPELFAGCAEAHPGRLAAALDIRAGAAAVTGWLATESRPLEELVQAWNHAPLAALILTSIDRDGTMAGPDLAVLSTVISLSRHPVVYSGGIGTLEHVRQVAAAGADGVILGRALHEGRVGLEAALAAV